MTKTENGNNHKNYRSTNLEKYLRMNEREKDLEIQKAVSRLQKRIQEILYFIETDTSRAAGPEPQKPDDKLS